METIIDKAMTSETGNMRPWQTRLETSNVTDQTGETRPGTDRNTEFRTTLTVGVAFWANQAQYHDAKRDADRTLLHHLYRDILSEFSYMRTAARGQDYESVLQAIGRAEEKLGLRS